jgi:hypothetical protein
VVVDNSGQSVYLTWDAVAAKWTSDPGTLAYPSGTGTVALWLDAGRPRLTVGGLDMVASCSGPDYAVFVGGAATGHAPESGGPCAGPGFVVQVKCGCPFCVSLKRIYVCIDGVAFGPAGIDATLPGVFDVGEGTCSGFVLSCGAGTFGFTTAESIGSGGTEDPTPCPCPLSQVIHVLSLDPLYAAGRMAWDWRGASPCPAPGPCIEIYDRPGMCGTGSGCGSGSGSGGPPDPCCGLSGESLSLMIPDGPHAGTYPLSSGGGFWTGAPFGVGRLTCSAGTWSFSTSGASSTSAGCGPMFAVFPGGPFGASSPVTVTGP